jgi:hypothetical protein
VSCPAHGSLSFPATLGFPLCCGFLAAPLEAASAAALRAMGPAEDDGIGEEQAQPRHLLGRLLAGCDERDSSAKLEFNRSVTRVPVDYQTRRVPHGGASATCPGAN